MKKVWKRVIAMLLVMVMIGGIAPVDALANINWHILPDGFFEKTKISLSTLRKGCVGLFDGLRLSASAETYHGKCGTNDVSWTLDMDTGVLSITGTGKMYDYHFSSPDISLMAPWSRLWFHTVSIDYGVTSIGVHAFYGCAICSVTIPDSVTSIGGGAFSNCAFLTNVTIPDSVTVIGDGAFEHSGIRHITIPEGVKSIGRAAFDQCLSLSCVQYNAINCEMESVHSSPFSNCTELQTVKIGNQVKVIPYYAFAYCKSLTDVTISNGVTNIRIGAFANCTSLTNVTIPDSVISIESVAFKNCTSLTNVAIPDSVTSIRESAFAKCNSLVSISVDANNTAYSSDTFGVLYNKDKTIIIQYPIGNPRTSFAIPDSVTRIMEYAFGYCSLLNSITISDHVASIDGYAFANCGNLSFVQYNAIKCKEMGSDSHPVFDNCSSLQTVQIGNQVQTIPAYAFYKCLSLKNVTFGKSVIGIGYAAFYSTRLTSITIPDSVTSIGGSAFANCTSLTSISVDENNAFYSSDTSGVLYNKNKTILIQYPIGNPHASFTIPNSVTSIGFAAFAYCTILTNIKISNSVTRIERYAFYVCRNLTSVTIPQSVTSITEYVFGYCTSLASVTIPHSVTSIGGYAFYECVYLQDVYYTGLESEWNSIGFGDKNNYLLSATIHYNYDPSFIVAPTGTRVTITDKDQYIYAGDTVLSRTQGGSADIHQAACYSTTITKSNVKPSDFTWTSGDESILKVTGSRYSAYDDRIMLNVDVLGISPGTTTLTVKTSDGASSTSSVTVLKPNDTPVKPQISDYVQQHLEFISKTGNYITMVNQNSFYNYVWKYEKDGAWVRRFACLRMWENMGDIAEMATLKFDDLEVSKNYYSLFLADLIKKIMDVQGKKTLELTVIEKYHDFFENLNDVFKDDEEWNANFKDFFSNFDLRYEKGKSGILFGDSNIGENGSLAMYKSFGSFYVKNQKTFNKLFSGLSKASQIIGYVDDIADIYNAYIEASNAYIVAACYKEVSDELFDMLKLARIMSVKSQWMSSL